MSTPNIPGPSAQPGPGAEDTGAEDTGGFLNRQTLTFIAFILAPVLGLVTAVMGLVLVLQDKVVAGVVFLVVLTQVFVVLGLWAYAQRRKLLGGTAPGASDGGAAPRR